MTPPYRAAGGVQGDWCAVPPNSARARTSGEKVGDGASGPGVRCAATGRAGPGRSAGPNCAVVALCWRCAGAVLGLWWGWGGVGAGREAQPGARRPLGGEGPAGTPGARERPGSLLFRFFGCRARGVWLLVGSVLASVRGEREGGGGLAACSEKLYEAWVELFRAVGAADRSAGAPRWRDRQGLTPGVRNRALAVVLGREDRSGIRSVGGVERPK